MSSSGSQRKLQFRHPVVVDIGCNCRRPKLSFLFSSSSRSHSTKPKSSRDPFSPATSTFTSSPPPDPSVTTTTTATSEDNPPSPPPPAPETVRRRRARKRKGAKRRVLLEEESVAVVKESSEPYADFRDSMLEMIVEKEMYGWDDLGDLLAQFIAVNSPRHHQLILRVFADLWTEATAVSSPPSP